MRQIEFRSLEFKLYYATVWFVCLLNLFSFLEYASSILTLGPLGLLNSSSFCWWCFILFTVCFFSFLVLSALSSQRCFPCIIFITCILHELKNLASKRLHQNWFLILISFSIVILKYLCMSFFSSKNCFYIWEPNREREAKRDTERKGRGRQKMDKNTREFSQMLADSTMTKISQVSHLGGWDPSSWANVFISRSCV